jgi:hypothetical protein
MTARKDEKKKIRELAEKMGCSYLTARRVFLSRKPPAAIAEGEQEPANLQLSASSEAVRQLPDAVAQFAAASLREVSALTKVQFLDMTKALGAPLLAFEESFKSLDELSKVQFPDVTKALGAPLLAFEESFKSLDELSKVQFPDVTKALGAPLLAFEESFKSLAGFRFRG